LLPAVNALRQTEECNPVYVIHNVSDAATRSASHWFLSIVA